MAFDLAERYLQIDTLLDPEDVNTNKSDKKSIMMYIMCIYQAYSLNSTTSADSPQPSTSKYIPAEPESKTSIVSIINVSSKELDEASLAKSIEDFSSIFTVDSLFTIKKNESINLTMVDNVTTNADNENNKINIFQNFIESYSRPVSTAKNIPFEIIGYQNAIEIVLTLLLEAEEILSKPLPDIEELSEAKANFQSHEEFMIKLSEYQEYVGKIEHYFIYDKTVRISRR